MLIKQKIVRNVSLTAHPVGCAHYVKEQIDYLDSRSSTIDISRFPKRVLIIGGSTGYGLASRLVASFVGKASTLNVSVEREPSENKAATPGWYNTKAFELEATKRGIFAQSLFKDAFADSTKEEMCDLIESKLGQIDLLVYSIASPMRVDPVTQEVYRSVIKPIGEPYSDLSVDVQSGLIERALIEPADATQIEQSVKVMGGEDWRRWIETLYERNLLSEGAKTVAFSYIGPEITYPIYREGTIGRAKEDLEKSATYLTTLLKKINGEAYVSVNKALVTRASAVIPVVPLYIALLYKVMKERGLHEDCIRQIYRLFSERLYTPEPVLVDQEGRIRIDDWEMKPEVQQEVQRRWALQKEGSLIVEGDLEGFKREFDNIHGFGYPSIDYSKEVDPTTVEQ